MKPIVCLISFFVLVAPQSLFAQAAQSQAAKACEDEAKKWSILGDYKTEAWNQSDAKAKPISMAFAKADAALKSVFEPNNKETDNEDWRLHRIWKMTLDHIAKGVGIADSMSLIPPQRKQQLTEPLNSFHELGPEIAAYMAKQPTPELQIFDAHFNESPDYKLVSYQFSLRVSEKSDDSYTFTVSYDDKKDSEVVDFCSSNIKNQTKLCKSISYGPGQFPYSHVENGTINYGEVTGISYVKPAQSFTEWVKSNALRMDGVRKAAPKLAKCIDDNVLDSDAGTDKYFGAAIHKLAPKWVQGAALATPQSSSGQPVK